MDKFSNKTINSWIKDFQKKISKKYSPEKIILFGSRARKDNLSDSDIDIIIVSKKFENIKWPNRISDISELWDGYITLEPLCYTPKEFQEKKSQLGIVSQAVKEGITL